MSYTSEVLADSPSVFLYLDEASSPFADSSGNSHVQTTSGTVTANQAGLTSNITVSVAMGGGSISEDFGSAVAYTALTVEAWYKSTNGNGVLWTSRGTSGNGLTLFIGNNGLGPSTGKISFGLDGGSIYIGIYTNATFHDGNPHHIVGTFSRASGTITNSDFKIYVDGTQEATTNATFGSGVSVPFTPSRNWIIGQHPAGWSNGTMTNANIAMMALYPTALSASRIQAHVVASGLPVARAALNEVYLDAVTVPTVTPAALSEVYLDAITIPTVTPVALTEVYIDVLTKDFTRYVGWGIRL